MQDFHALQNWYELQTKIVKRMNGVLGHKPVLQRFTRSGKTLANEIDFGIAVSFKPQLWYIFKPNIDLSLLLFHSCCDIYKIVPIKAIHRFVIVIHAN